MTQQAPGVSSNRSDSNIRIEFRKVSKRFAPQNAGAAPVTTSAPTLSLPSISSIAEVISATIGAVSVLRSSGLFRVSVATPSVTETRTRLMGGHTSTLLPGAAPPWPTVCPCPQTQCSTT